MKNKIVILIPTLNPEPNFITFTKNLLKNDNINLIIVNDGSAKETKYIFSELSKLKNCKILTHDNNKGKGCALKTGFKYYLENYKENGTTGIITADSDGQHTIEDILEIAELLKSETNKTLIIGSRNFKNKNVPFKSKFGNILTSHLFKLLYKKKINDTQSGLRGISYNYIKDCININGEKFEYELNVLIHAVKNNINIKETNITTIYIENNKKTNFKACKDSIRIYKELFKNRK